MDNQQDNNLISPPIKTFEEINLSNINWNKLSIEDFQQVEAKLQENFKKTKVVQQKHKKEVIIAQKKNGRSSGFKLVKLRGNVYNIKEVTYERLRLMKSAVSKEKLIEEIISSNSPIVTL